MKILTLLSFILLSTFQTLYAQNDTVYIDCPGVAGGTWTPENRYIARCNVFVPFDSVLTIQPGVKIEFQEGYSFKVEGQLNAVGNSSNRIEIKPYDGYWKGLTFGTPSGEMNMNTSLLSYVDIDCGGSSENSEAVVIGKHKIVSLNNIRVSDAQKAIRVTGFATIDNITQCEFEEVAEGIVFQYCDVVTGIKIVSCTFENILETAVLISLNQAFLEDIEISGCSFDNSDLESNLSGSAVYITLNNQLTSVSLSNNDFKAFSQQENSPACIHIFDNDILDLITLEENDVSLCGGETPTSPNSDFGGLYINESSKVILEGNNFNDNTGRKSGAAYLRAGKIYFSGNEFRDNRNNYTGNENFAGAMTIIAGDRIEFDGDIFETNVSAKSGGAMYIGSKSNSNPIDLFFAATTLENNSASNEGGALLINATLDSLNISGSTISGNFSSAGSGGCFSIITTAFNDLTLATNTIQDNFVSENSDGGFLYLRHDPSLVPEYGNISLHDNTCLVTGHNNNSNYNLVYSVIKSFPESISIVNDNVSAFYPVEGFLYHFELLEPGPAPSEQEVQLEFDENEYQDNRCPLVYFANNYTSVQLASSNNVVSGNESSFGTFLTIECQKAPSLDFGSEHYSNLISGTSGGAVSVKTVEEIGEVYILEVISEGCFAVDGNGGHFALESESSDISTGQNLNITRSQFVNEGNTDATGANGGAVYYSTQGNLSNVLLDESAFDNLYAQENGGAVFIRASAIEDISITGSETSFIGCTAGGDGGALSAEASKEIGSVTIDGLVSSGCYSLEGNGGHISLVSLSSDAAIIQILSVLNSTFTNQEEQLAANKGGAVYYNTKGNLNSADVTGSDFNSFKSAGDGAGLFIEAKEISLVNIQASAFNFLSTVDSRGGAMFVNAFDGNINAIDNNISTFTECNAKQDGGALFFNSSKEIGTVTIDSAGSTANYSSEGNGGHFAFISGTSNPSLTQRLSISNSEFDNSGITNVTGGNGGAVYYHSPAKLEALDITACNFSGLKAGNNAGALYINTKETGQANILGSSFTSNTSLDTAGAVYLNAANGNIAKLWIAPLGNIPSTFTSCSSKNDGGAICAKASMEIGTVIFDTVLFSKCFSNDGNGGHASLISLGTDGTLAQELEITGSVFSNEGLSSFTGGNGGMIYYQAASDVSSVAVDASEFTEATAVKDGGSIYLNAAKINAFDVTDSRFSGSVSKVMSGGAIYVKTGNGLISGNFGGNKFFNCTAALMGGSVCIEDAKFDNTSEEIAWTANTYRKTTEEDMPATGGAVYCKGINAVTFESDSVISQASGEKGGFVYLEKVYRSEFEGIYTYNNTSGSGGVIYHNGDEGSSFSQSAKIFNSTFLFNNAELTGGCFYITGIDSVVIGKEGNKNTFVANQSLSTVSNDQVGGGVFYIGDAQSMDVNFNSFYVNKSHNNGGIGIVSNVSSSVLIQGNSFLSNQARAGGAFTFINSFGSSVIAENMFSHNSSSEQAGALLFSPSATNSFLIRDNTFFMNNTGKLGGAIASYRPVRITRNLFRENHLTDINPNVDHKGTTVYMSGNGDQALIKNCVFDQNYYDENPVVASVYFDALQGSFPDYSIANCSFFNFDDQHLSVYNENGPDTVVIQNSIFTQRQNITREAVVYFNETVKARYCDLIYSEINDPENFNVDEYVYFNIGDYFFDSTQYPVDQGNPDPSFNDFHMPPGYGTVRNDQGVSGGPDNPDTNGVFIFHEPVNLPTNFDIVVLSHDCFTYSFECRGEFVDSYEYFYWFMPDSIIRTEEPVLTYTFSSDLYGNHSITALGHDVSNADIYGFGQYVVNLDIIRINSLKTSYDNNLIQVPSVPFTFNVAAEIYHENDTPYSFEWSVVESPGLEYTINGFETGAIVEILKITALPASMVVKYTLTACGRTLESTIAITLQTTDLWGYPNISFYPEPNNIIDTTSSFIITFDKIMMKNDGTELTNNELSTYFPITFPGCPDLEFIRTVEYRYTTNETVINIDQVYTSTQLPGMLCNGDYAFSVEYDQLYTQFYRLNHPDTSKTYSVCCNDISETGTGLDAIVYPNPFRDIVHITFSAMDDYYIVLTDVRGQEQKSGKFSGVNEVNLNLGSLSDGIYILRVLNSGGEKQYFMKINKITQ